MSIDLSTPAGWGAFTVASDAFSGAEKLNQQLTDAAQALADWQPGDPANIRLHLQQQIGILHSQYAHAIAVLAGPAQVVSEGASPHPFPTVAEMQAAFTQNNVDPAIADRILKGMASKNITTGAELAKAAQDAAAELSTSTGVLTTALPSILAGEALKVGTPGYDATRMQRVAKCTLTVVGIGCGVIMVVVAIKAGDVSGAARGVATIAAFAQGAVENCGGAFAPGG
jgi:hypothetical protein